MPFKDDDKLMEDFCPKCGQYTGGDSVCPNCGAKIFDDDGLQEQDEDEEQNDGNGSGSTDHSDEEEDY